MKKLEESSLANYFTFEASKNLPLHRSFYYKEAYASRIIEHFLNFFEAKKSVFDPFTGIGTTPLVAKSQGLKATGIDVSPLAVFVSKTKCANYSKNDLGAAREELKQLFKSRTETGFKWDFELFSPRRFFSKRNYNDICFIREKCEQIENEKVGALFLLALLSCLPQAGFFIKDGGVLKLEKSKCAMPVKDAFKKKIKQIIHDLENHPITGPIPNILLADARTFCEGEYECFITSPPYLNNIDYSKVYGLELSLLAMDKNASLKMRKESLRSFITKDADKAQVPKEVGEIGERIPIVGEYFADMELVLKNLYKMNQKGGALIVGNSVIQGEYIKVDEILGEIGQRIGFEYEIPLWMERIADVKPAKIKIRESAIVFKK